MSKARILLVHPEPSALTLMSSILKSLGHAIDEAANDRVAVRQMERGGVDLMLAGADPADVDALELLSYMRRKHRQVPVILLFSTPMPERAEEALRLGARAVLRYPVPATELRGEVVRALAPRGGPAPPAAVDPAAPATAPAGSQAPPSVLSGVPHPRSPGAAPPAPLRAEQLARELGIVGDDPKLRQAIALAATIAPTHTPILIVGEPGTGKSLLARMIHALGPRGEQPLVVLDTATLAEHERRGDRASALTDAEGDWSAKLHQAHSGTLVLDEVAGLPENHQAYLLQALQERAFESSGRHLLAPDVRFLFSTSDDLLSLAEQGKFRPDLYYWINTICLRLPPLRHRVGDIEPLAEYFRDRFAHEFAKNIVGFTHDALDVLTRHDWPGNVRELKGVIRRGVILCQGTRVTSGLLASSLSPARTTRSASPIPRPHLPMSIRPLSEALEESERRIILQTLQALHGNRKETARVLEINRTTLYKKMKKYGLLVDGPIWVYGSAHPFPPETSLSSTPALAPDRPTRHAR
jgi:two-component system response regulator HydG